MRDTNGKVIGAQAGPTPQNAVRETRGALFQLVEPSIILGRIKPVYMNVDMSRENIDTIFEMSQHRPFCFISDIRAAKGMSRATRTQGTTDPKLSGLVGLALIVERPLSRVLGNFFIQVASPPYPTRLFNDQERALMWARVMLEDDRYQAISVH